MGKSKPKTKPVSEERILQILIGHADGSGDKREWQAAALYMQRENQRLSNDLAAIRRSIAVLVCAAKMKKSVMAQLFSWLDEQTPEITAGNV